MGRARDEAALVKECAGMHSVSDRAVRNWRDAKDPRWLEFLAERAASKSVRPGGKNFVGKPSEEEVLPGEGLEFEIIRLKKECVDLARRARGAKETDDLTSEALLNRMLDSKRETLRKMEKDTPDIQRESGEVLPKRIVEQSLIQYAAGVSSVLENLADRILTLLTGLDPMVEVKVRDEIMEARRAASEVTLLPAAA